MMKYKVHIDFNDKDKKINCIKDVRQAFGIGLKEAKDFFELRTSDRFAIVNAEQLAEICFLQETDNVNMFVQSIERYEHELKDFSHETSGERWYDLGVGIPSTLGDNN